VRSKDRAMSWLVGVDAGASRTTAFVSRADLEVVARATGAAGAVAPGTAAQASTAILATIRAATAEARAGQASALVVGAAGAGREPERTDLERALRQAGLAGRLRVTTDIEIALVAAFGDGPGILLLAGTGSGACARLPNGETRRTGGHGWQFGDEGSGYALARAALAAVARAADGRGPATALSAATTRAAGVATPQEVVAWARTAPRVNVADLARVVQQVAAQHDAVARALVEQAGKDLVAHVQALLPQFPRTDLVPVAFAGGLVCGGQPVRQVVTHLLAEAEPRVCVNEAMVEPPRGALLLASRLA
jgi:N-acetylglucosamine kinase-like BadF-type ATPase